MEQKSNEPQPAGGRRRSRSRHRTNKTTSANVAEGGTGNGTLGAIVKQAKSQSIELKNLLKTADPWDRTVLFHRSSLRSLYLSLLFPSNISSSSTHPLSLTRQLSTLGLLWLETSHSLIHLYRSRFALFESSNPPRGVGPTARRRLIHSFRTFLAGEDEFFARLVGRLAREGLEEPDWTGLKKIGVVIDPADAAVVPPEGAVGDGGVEGRDEHHLLATNQGIKRNRGETLQLVQRAVIFYGDIARYRELYSDSGSTTPKRGGNGGGGPKEKKPKNWTKAYERYHIARLLFPDSGNPSNQMAVLAQYGGEPLASTYRYYRALAVKAPFTTARQNLDTAYRKAVARWFDEGEGEKEVAEGEEGIRFQEAFVVLHGLYFTRTRLDDRPELGALISRLFRTAVETRQLSSDTIVKSIVTALSALWDARMFRSSKTPSQSQSQHQRERRPDPDAEKGPNLEPQLLIHVLDLFSGLLDISSRETAELASQVEGQADLALRISAVVRRVLPALRILSKWLMGQLEYISRVEARVERDSSQSSTTPPESSTARTVSLDRFQSALRSFWKSYAGFANTLQRTFEIDELPSAVEMGVWLEEDVDMLGFAPIRRWTRSTANQSNSGNGAGEKSSQDPGQGRDPADVDSAREAGRAVHPNTEHLMRVAVVLSDAKLVAEAQESLVVLKGNEFVFQDVLDADSPESKEAAEVALASERLSSAFGTAYGRRLAHALDDFALDEEDEEDSADEEGLEGVGEEEEDEEDPVDLAMRVGGADGMDMGEEEEDEEDERVVYQPRTSTLPPGLAGSVTPPGLGRPAVPPNPHGQNASDLLLQVLNGGLLPASSPSLSPSLSPLATPPSAAMSSPFPTGLTTSVPGAHRSIWASTPVPDPQAGKASFEALPNVTHAPSAIGTGRTGSFSATHPQSGNAMGASSPSKLFANFTPFSPPPPAPTSLPPPGLQPNPSYQPSPPQARHYPPGLPSSFQTPPGLPSNLQPQQQQYGYGPPVSELSPHANVFSQSPQKPNYFAGPNPQASPFGALSPAFQPQGQASTPYGHQAPYYQLPHQPQQGQGQGRWS